MADKGKGEEYARGVAQGEINARLAVHDQHFTEINGSIAALVTETRTLSMSMQRLADGIESRDKATKDALETRQGELRDAARVTNKRLLYIGLFISAMVIAVNVILAFVPH